MSFGTLCRSLLRYSLLLSVALFSPIVDAQYHAGFRAYVDGNFERARSHWLTAAESKDAKSMFNLGLLHEQNKLPDSDIEKAKKWYQLASQNGYAAGAYQLGLLTLNQGGSSAEAKQHILRSAQQGYAPAQRYLGLPISARSVTKVATEAQSPYLSETWINSQRASNWTIQLLAFEDLQKVQAFIDEHGLRQKTAYYVERKNNRELYKLLYGVYRSKDKATFARQNLPTHLAEYGPWLREISTVHAITKR